MAESEDTIHEMFILLKGCSRVYVTSENIEQVCITHAELFRHIDGILQPSHDYTKFTQPARISERQEILLLPP